MKTLLSKRVKLIEPSVTQAITERSRELSAGGVDVINLGIGQPDFPTPDHIKFAGEQAIRENVTGYTAAGGSDEVRDAVIHRYLLDTGVTYARDEVIVSAGARQVLFNLFQSLIDPGDEVVVLVPCWVANFNQIRLPGGVPVYWHLTPEEGFRPDMAALAGLLTGKTKAVLINTPANPTGLVWTREELLGLSRLCHERGVLLVVDEVYSRFVYDRHIHCFPPAFSEAFKKNTVMVGAVSKNYAMTGWRIGYGVGPRDIVAGMLKVQSLSTACPCSISQKAAVAALTGPQEDSYLMAAVFQERKETLVRELSRIPHVTFTDPEGAFYVLCDFSAYLPGRFGKNVLESAVDLCMLFIEEAHVASFPGDSFGIGGHVRFSFAVGREKIGIAINRIIKVLSQIILEA